MSEVIVSGDVVVRKAPAPPPPPTVSVEIAPPVAPPEQLPDDGADVRLRHVSGDPISEDGLREEIRRQKGEVAPIIEWRADQAMPPPGEHESFAKQLKRASEGMNETRRRAAAEELLAIPGLTPEQARYAVDTVAEAAPPKAVPVNDDGQPHRPLDDHQPIRETDAFLNKGDLKRSFQNYRDLQERQRQQLVEDYRRSVEAEQARVQAEVQAAVPQPAPRASESQPQPDVNQERARLEANYRQLAQLHEMQIEERAAVNEQVQIRQWLDLNYPPQYRTPEGWRQLQQTNPGHAAYLQEVVPAAVVRDRELNGGLQQAALIRQGQQAQAAQVQQANFNSWASQQDEAARAAIAADIPEAATDDGWKRLQQATKRALRESTGLTDKQLTAEWEQGRWRSIPEQRMLARLGRDQLGREGLKT